MMMPSVTGEVKAARSSDAGQVDAGVGEREQRHDDELVHGCSSYWSRSLGEIADSTPRCAARASAGVGCSRNVRGELDGLLELLARGRVGAGREPDRQSGDDRVDPGLEHREPDPDRRARSRAAVAALGATAATSSSPNSADRDHQRTIETCSV